MRQSLFAGRRLRASYRCIPMDAILALLDQADEQDDLYIGAYCFHRPHRLRSCRKEEEL
jgi:hypothetical protein